MNMACAQWCFLNSKQQIKNNVIVAASKSQKFNGFFPPIQCFVQLIRTNIALSLKLSGKVTWILINTEIIDPEVSIHLFKRWKKRQPLPLSLCELHWIAFWNAFRLAFVISSSIYVQSHLCHNSQLAVCIWCKINCVFLQSFQPKWWLLQR